MPCPCTSNVHICSVLWSLYNKHKTLCTSLKILTSRLKIFPLLGYEANTILRFCKYVVEQLLLESVLRALIWKPDGSTTCKFRHFRPFFVIAVEDRFIENMNIGKWSLVKKFILVCLVKKFLTSVTLSIVRAH